MQPISALNYKMIFLEVRGFSPDILTLVKKGAIGNTRLLLDSQHNNYNSVTI